MISNSPEKFSASSFLNVSPPSQVNYANSVVSPQQQKPKNVNAETLSTSSPGGQSALNGANQYFSYFRTNTQQQEQDFFNLTEMPANPVLSSPTSADGHMETSTATNGFY